MSPTNEVQGYCLRWNNHHEQLLTVLESLYQEGSFVDVTLASEGKSIQAHRLVLCACSPYFQELLFQHWDKHAIIFLKDVPFEQLKALVDYMYRGEVNIAQDQLSSLLSTAESLQIKGLTDSDRSEPKDPSNAKMNNIDGGLKVRKNADEVAESLRINQIGTNMNSGDCEASSDSVTALVEQQQTPSLSTPTVSLPFLNSTTSSMQQPLHQPLYTSNQMIVTTPAANTAANFVVVAPKLETEHEGDVSVSGEDEDWSDSDLAPPTSQHAHQHSHSHVSQGEAATQTFPPVTPFAHVPWGESMAAAAAVAAAAAGPSALVAPNSLGAAYIPTQVTNTGPPGLAVPVPSRGRGTRNGRRSSRPPSVATLIQDKPYVCTRCGRCYSRRGALIQHQRYECGVEPQFSCPMCPYKIKRKDSLNRHIRNMHHNQNN